MRLPSQEKFIYYERNFRQLRCGKPDVIVMLHDLVLSNCQFPARQAADSSVSATHLKKRRLLVLVSLKEMYLYLQQMSMLPKHKEIQE